MQMPAGIPDYDQFMRMTPAQRKNLLKISGFFAGKQLQPLLMVVYEKDPDPQIRQMAREMLEKQGVQIRVEGGGLSMDTPSTPSSDAMRPADSPIQSRQNLGIPITDDLSRRAVESLKRGQGVSSTPTSSPSQPGQSLSESGATVYYTTAGGTFESPFSGPDTLTGGDGRVMQRSQMFPSVFLLYPKNLKYVRGESLKPTTSSGNGLVGVIFVVVFMVIFFGISGFGESMLRQFSSISRFGLDMGNLMRSPLSIFMGIFVLIIGIISVVSIRNARRMSRLSQTGSLLIGQASAVNGRWVSTGSGSSRSRSYKVSVAYRVRLPDGRTVNGQDTATRSDLARGVLPVPGTPVAILYANDDDKMLL